MKKSRAISLETVHTHTHTHTHTDNLKNKGITLITLVVIIIILLILSGITIVQLTNNGAFEIEKLATTDNIEFSYDINKIEENKIQILIKIKDEEIALNKIEYPNGDILNCNGKNQIGIDYTIEIGIEYIFKIISVNGEEKESRIKIEDTDIAYVNFYKEITGAGTYDTDIVSYNGNIMVENNQIIIENDGIILGQLQQLHGGITPHAHTVCLYKNDQLIYNANPSCNTININLSVYKGDKIYIKQYTDNSRYPVTGKAEIVFIKK